MSNNLTKYLKKAAFGLVLAAVAVPSMAFASYGDLSVSQSNVTLNVGQSASVSLYTASNQVANLTSITNTNVVNATVSNNVLSLYAIANGTSQIGVCATNQACAYVYVTVNGYNNGNNGNYGSVTLSQNSVSMTSGQNMNVSIYSSNGSNNTFYISNNTNSNIASATISGSSLNVYAYNSGNTTVTVCNSNYSNNNGSNNCASLYITVTGSNNGNNQISLSQNNIDLSIGQSAYVTITSNNGYYGNNFYIASNTNSGIAVAAINGNQLGINAVGFGTTSINICNQNYGSGSGNCASLYVNVNNINNNNNNCSYYYTCNNNSGLYFSNVSPTQPVLNQYFSYAFQVSGGNAPYYFYINSGSLPYGLTLSSNGVLTGTPTQSGSFNFTIRANDNYSRSAVSNTIYMTVSNNSNGNNFNNCYYLNGYYTCANRDGSVLGASVYTSGTLIKENNTIYIVYKNTRSGFANFAAFSGLGYKLENVLYVSNSGLVDSGHIVTTAAMAHPWGTWIKSGNTIYFVHDSGLIPIASYDIFLNNGGVDANVVSANVYDFNKPVLPVLGFNDTRIK